MKLDIADRTHRQAGRDCKHPTVTRWAALTLLIFAAPGCDNVDRAGSDAIEIPSAENCALIFDPNSEVPQNAPGAGTDATARSSGTARGGVSAAPSDYVYDNMICDNWDSYEKCRDTNCGDGGEPCLRDCDADCARCDIDYRACKVGCELIDGGHDTSCWAGCLRDWAGCANRKTIGYFGTAEPMPDPRDIAICCDAGNFCAWDNDGNCDCGGIWHLAWDRNDCSIDSPPALRSELDTMRGVWSIGRPDRYIIGTMFGCTGCEPSTYRLAVDGDAVYDIETGCFANCSAATGGCGGDVGFARKVYGFTGDGLLDRLEKVASTPGMDRFTVWSFIENLGLPASICYYSADGIDPEFCVEVTEFRPY